MKNILCAIVFTTTVTAVQARPQTAIPQGIFQRLIKIKYSTELYLINAQKKSSSLKGESPRQNESLDSALSIYNTIRWNLDGLVYQLSGDLVAANSPKKLRRLNDWCLKQSLSIEKNEGNATALGGVVNIEAATLKNIERLCEKHLPAFSPISENEKEEGQMGDIGSLNMLGGNLNNSKNINLTTNVFYLIKDSYSLIKGLSDLKSQKTMALVEILDQMRLASPQELLKQIR